MSELIYENHWMILKGQDQLGPYTYEAMIQMRQSHKLDESDLIWSPQLDKWTKLCDVPDFSADRLARLFEREQTGDLFNRRAHPRVQVLIPCLVHNDQQIWKGDIKNLSIGGGLMMIQNPWLAPGETIHLHVRQAYGLNQAFNCYAEILTKRAHRKRVTYNSQTDYSIRFLDLPKTVTDDLAQVINLVINKKNNL